MSHVIVPPLVHHHRRRHHHYCCCAARHQLDSEEPNRTGPSGRSATRQRTGSTCAGAPPARETGCARWFCTRLRRPNTGPPLPDQHTHRQDISEACVPFPRFDLLPLTTKYFLFGAPLRVASFARLLPHPTSRNPASASAYPKHWHHDEQEAIAGVLQSLCGC